MKKIAESCRSLLSQSELELKNALLKDADGWHVSDDSIHKATPGAAVLILRNDTTRRLLVIARDEAELPAGFVGQQSELSGTGMMLDGALDAANAAALRHYFPWCAPKSLRNERTTIGCGDRLGLASRGHIAAARRFKVSPVLAQQSIRELALTGRTFRQVVDDAVFMVFESDYQSGYGADGDHLKKLTDIATALEAGMPMITLDLSDVMNPAAGTWSEAEIASAFRDLPDETRTRIGRIYKGLS